MFRRDRRRDVVVQESERVLYGMNQILTFLEDRLGYSSKRVRTAQMAFVKAHRGKRSRVTQLDILKWMEDEIHGRDHTS